MFLRPLSLCLGDERLLVCPLSICMCLLLARFYRSAVREAVEDADGEGGPSEDLRPTPLAPILRH